MISGSPEVSKSNTGTSAPGYSLRTSGWMMLLRVSTNARVVRCGAKGWMMLLRVSTNARVVRCGAKNWG